MKFGSFRIKTLRKILKQLGQTTHLKATEQIQTWQC